MSLDVLKLLRGELPQGLGELCIAQAATTDPDPLTFVVQGADHALDADIFTIPLGVYPICKDDTFYILPLSGSDGQRWGILSKINNTNVVGIMTSATTCQVTGIGREYDADDLLIPPYVAVNGNLESGDTHSHGTFTRPLQAGDRVTLFPVAVDGAVKYAIANYF